MQARLAKADVMKQNGSRKLLKGRKMERPATSIATGHMRRSLCRAVVAGQQVSTPPGDSNDKKHYLRLAGPKQIQTSNNQTRLLNEHDHYSAANIRSK